MEIDDLIKILQTFGFPVVVALYLLWRIDPFLRAISVSQAQQIELLRILTRGLRSDDDDDPPRRDSHRRS